MVQGRGMSMILKWKSGGLRVVAGLMVAVIVSGLCAAQTSETDGIPTKDGVIQMTIPKGWSRVGGPGLAFFLRNGMDSNTANAWIYISSAPIGPNEEYRNFNSYVDYDVTTFRDKYKAGTVQKEQPLYLAKAKTRARVYTFESGERSNAHERIIYIEEPHRVLILVLSARNFEAFDSSMQSFLDFATSYRGPTTEKKP
jgi:hypothetical protein